MRCRRRRPRRCAFAFNEVKMGPYGTHIYTTYVDEFSFSMFAIHTSYMGFVG